MKLIVSYYGLYLDFYQFWICTLNMFIPYFKTSSSPCEKWTRSDWNLQVFDTEMKVKTRFIRQDQVPPGVA